MKKIIISALLLLPLLAAAQEQPKDSAGCDCSSIEWENLDLLEIEEYPCAYRCLKQKVSRGPWSSNIDFAWGFHNWGGERLNGLMGTEGDAAVRTSFNHLLLTFNYPVLYSNRVALYAGVGLEWDKYKFHRGDIHFDLTSDPFRLVNGAMENSESRLLTRYVILPIEVKFDLGRHWKLGIAAIGGLHWSGSHTGLRRDVVDGTTESHIKDYSVNNHINPYKLDTRLSVSYRSLGLYIQTSMLPAFKSGCEELFPVKFGIIL